MIEGKEGSRKGTIFICDQKQFTYCRDSEKGC